MRTLRSPEGCAWDREQTVQSLRPFVLEETYELLQAIDEGDAARLKEELGDVLFELVFIAQISAERDDFTIDDAVDGVVSKLVRRHPHVFTADGTPLAPEGTERPNPSQVRERWEALKARERAAAAEPARSMLHGVPRTLPALLRAYELSARAATVGFDWSGPGDVLAKIDEEVAELREAVGAGANATRVEDELGDVLFTIANLSRKLGVEPESALRRAADKFQRRFEGMEAAARERGSDLTALPPEAQEQLWTQVKASR